jgi:oligopeptide transport system substrate-binding protein
VTNGAFKLKKLEEGVSSVFERNPAYHGRSTGNLERVEMSFVVRQDSDFLQMYESGDLDYLNLDELFPAEMDRARQRFAGEYLSAPWLTVAYIGFDVSRQPFNDPRVRRAFTLATPRERLASVAHKGFEFPATGGLIPPGMPGHSSNIALPYDPDQARQLLAEAGYPGGRRFPELECLTGRRSSSLPVNDFLHAQWREILGIEINWEFLEWGEFINRVYKDAPNVWRVGYIADSPDPDNILRVSEWKRNTHWREDEYERLVDEARTIMDQDERMKLYEQADQILIEEAPIIPLTYGRYHMLVKQWVKQFIFSAMNPPFWKDVIIEPH